MTPTPAFVLHLACTAFMTGLIWLIQLVHYPLFEKVGSAFAKTYHAEHMRRITPLVLPVMLAEVGTGLWWAYETFRATGDGTQTLLLRGTVVADAVLLAMIWLLTMFVQIPDHRKIAEGSVPETDEKFVGGPTVAVRGLVRRNWWRTILWSVRLVGLVCLAILA